MTPCLRSQSSTLTEWLAIDTKFLPSHLTDRERYLLICLSRLHQSSLVLADSSALSDFDHCSVSSSPDSTLSSIFHQILTEDAALRYWVWPIRGIFYFQVRQYADLFAWWFAEVNQFGFDILWNEVGLIICAYYRCLSVCHLSSAFAKCWCTGPCCWRAVFYGGRGWCRSEAV